MPFMAISNAYRYIIKSNGKSKSIFCIYSRYIVKQIILTPKGRQSPTFNTYMNKYATCAKVRQRYIKHTDKDSISYVTMWYFCMYGNTLFLLTLFSSLK